MAANTPPGPNRPDHNPDPAEGTIPPADAGLGPVEPLDVADDGLVLTGEGVSAPPGVTPPPAETPAPLTATSFDLAIPGDDPEAAVGGPTAPAEGWYESSTRLPTSVPPPEHPPSQSSIDIDLDDGLTRATPKPTQTPTFLPADPARSALPESDSSIEIELDSPSAVSTKPPTAGPPPRYAPSPSAADIDLPPTPRPGEEPSDIFSTARRPPGSDALGTGGSDVLADVPRALSGSGSDLFATLPVPGAGGSGMGSSVFDQSGAAGTSGSALFGDSLPAAGGSGSNVLDAPPEEDAGHVDFDAAEPTGNKYEVTGRHARDEDEPDEEFIRTEHNITLPEDDKSEISGFDKLDKGESGSDLFGDATIVDVNLLSDPGRSGIDLHDPDGSPEGSGGMSSIFSRADQPQPSDGGRVDLESIPHMGEGEERTDMMFNPEAPTGPGSIFGGPTEPDALERSAVSYDLPGRQGSQDALVDYNQDSGSINWSQHEDEKDPSDLIDTTMAVRPDDGLTEADLADDEEDALGAGSGRAKRPVDEESVFAMPAIAAPEGSGLSDKLDEAVAAGVPVAGAGAKKAKPGGVSLATKRRPPPAAAAAPARPAEGRKRGGLLVGALGVLLGAGLGAAGMYLAGGSGSPSTSSPGGGTAARGNDGGAPTVQPPARADVGLIAADPAAALKAFEQAGDTPEAKAGRGQARWLARVREAAAANQPLNADDPELAKAKAELQAVFDAAPGLQSPEEKQAGLRAALHLGLMHEVLGDPAGAEKVYQDARAKLPFARVFEAALQRVGVMKKDAAGGARKYSLLTPVEAAELAGAVVLLEFPPVQEAADVEKEPAYHFWRAINYSVNWQQPRAFQNATAAVQQAKKLHEERRLKLLGMGLNPLSDPTEQAFIRVCDELALYWAFKGKLYDSPVTGPQVKKVGTGPTLDDLIRAKQEVGTVAARLKDAEADKQRVAKLANDLNATRTANTKLTTENKTLAAEKEKATADLAAATRDLGVKAKEAAAAKEELAAADARLKTAEAAVAAVIAKLKDVKLIDPKAEQTTAVAALPEAVKKAVVLTGKDTQAGELTAALDEARRLREAAEKKAKDTEAALAAARDEAAKKVAALEAEAKKAESRVATEVKKATDAAAAEVAKLTAERQAESKRYEEKLAAQAEQFRGQLAAVRSGAVVPLADVERAALDKAKRAYASGLEAYRVRQYGTAESWFAEAVKDDPADARYWYYLGLSKWSQGKVAEAQEDFKKGAEWEARNRPGRRAVGEALVWVQGPARTALDAYRP